MDYRIYIIFGLVVIAAVAKAFDDSLTHEKQVRFDGGKWFNYPNRTWQNKWRYHILGVKKEKFIGSSTIFVWATDAWHFFNTLQYAATNSALTILFVGVYKLDWYYYFVVFFTLSFIRGMVFEYVYRFLNTRKTNKSWNLLKKKQPKAWLKKWTKSLMNWLKKLPKVLQRKK